MINIKFNKELKILEVEFTGDISLKELIDYGEKIRISNDLPRELKILTDARESVYKISHNDLRVVVMELKKQIKPYKSVKTAVIQTKPVETALSMLVNWEGQIDGYEHQVFATRHAALNWLLY
ncbi:MAG: STAS/SEC14 domain-containing protein [Bacteroidales bacterium]